jgi:small-conductance mechanosensitive channel
MLNNEPYKKPNYRNILSIISLLILLLLARAPALAQDKSEPASLKIPGGASVSEFMAGLSDEQVRRLLIEELRKQAEAQAPAPLDQVKDRGQVMMGLAKRLIEQAGYMLGGIKILPGSIAQSVSRLHNAKGSPGIWGIFLLFILAALAGLALESLGRRFTRNSRGALQQSRPQGSLRILAGLGTMTGLEFFYGLAFIIGYIAASLIVGLFSKPAGQALEAYIGAFIYLRSFILLNQFLTAKDYSSLRLLPLSDASAANLQRVILLVGLVGFFWANSFALLRANGLAEPVFMLGVVLAGINVTVVLIATLFMEKSPFTWARASGGKPRPGKAFRGLACLYLAAVCLLWISRFLILGKGAPLLYFISVAALPVFVSLDRMAYRLCQGNFAAATEDGESQVIPPVPGLTGMAKMMHRVIRLVLVIFFLMGLAELWTLMPNLRSSLTRPVLTVCFTLFGGYLLWASTRYYILKRATVSTAGGGGEEEIGAGGNRLDTLLDLLRKFISALVVSVSLIVVLAAVGVDIGPLLAGAGVLGLAVGFGAQTLVKDIVSGIFFLIDDAFRVGDYVEAGSTKGTVEAITIRSLKLRHPLGMVHTIPFGNLGSITNFSRDWIIVKLEFRVPFDSNLKAIKKIVKKINAKIQDNEEYGPGLLAPVKFQGVKKMDDDSALVVRIKFMAKPGTQFLIKREVYRLVQKMFTSQGIEFAARKVMVQIPQIEQNGGHLSPETAQAVGAAAIVEEDKRKAAGPPKKEQGPDF